MPLHQHYEDVHFLVKEQSFVAEIIVWEAMKLTHRVLKREQGEFDEAILQTLTALVVSQLDFDEMKCAYIQRESQEKVKQQIDDYVRRSTADAP